MKRRLVAQLVLFVAALGDWLGLKQGWWRHPTAWLAWLVAALLLLLAVEALRVVIGLRRGTLARSRGVAELVLVAGLLLAGGAGMANWLLGLQGYAVLTEGERMELALGRQLQEFEAGPLSDLEEMGITLELAEVDLIPAPGGFAPESRILCGRSARAPEALVVRAGGTAACASLVLHQGAFGFAPHVVILRDGGTVFDRVVPFVSRREGPHGVTFEGDFTVEREDLRVRGAVDLETLDAWMRGHPKLRLEVSRGEALLGRGELLPGHFAELEEGYRIGFAGLQKWAEIDISRRHYGRWVLAGAAVSVLGALTWALVVWRRW